MSLLNTHSKASYSVISTVVGFVKLKQVCILILFYTSNTFCEHRILHFHIYAPILRTPYLYRRQSDIYFRFSDISNWLEILQIQ